VAKRISELTAEQVKERRKQRQEYYHSNPERQREYSRAHKARKATGDAVSPRPYDPQEYAEEWAWLTEAGMLSRDIIDRSTPSTAWFKRHITPLVKYANCPGCGRKYLVENSKTLLICGRDCPKNNYTADYHVARSKRTLEISHG
jgi:hypothetical protein